MPSWTSESSRPREYLALPFVRKKMSFFAGWLELRRREEEAEEEEEEGRRKKESFFFERFFKESYLCYC